MNLSHAYSIAERREIARRRLPRVAWDFLERGAEDDITLRRNRAVFDEIKLKPRTEVERVMALIGCPAVSALDATFVTPPDGIPASVAAR